MLNVELRNSKSKIQNPTLSQSGKLPDCAKVFCYNFPMNKVFVRLLQSHTHAGKEYQPGDEIGVTSRQAEWLISMAIAQPIETRDTCLSGRQGPESTCLPAGKASKASRNSGTVPEELNKGGTRTWKRKSTR